MTRTVLITGARAPVAVDLARCFLAAGWRPHLADSVSPWTARLSSVGRGHVHRLPPPRHRFTDFAAALRDLVDRLDPQLVIPTCEEVFYLAEAGRRHGFADRVFAPPLDLLRRLHSKILFNQLLRDLGQPAPDSWTVENAADMAALPLPPGELVLKPEFSRFGTATLIRPHPSRLGDLAVSPGQRWAAQRHIAGQEICLWSAAIGGRLVASALYRPKWRQGHSASYVFERIDLPAALEIAVAVAAGTGMTGQLSFDMIAAPDGTIFPIECNPRAVSGLHLFGGQADLARALTGQIASAAPSSDICHLAPAMAVLGVPQALASGRWRAFRADWARGEDALGRNGDRWCWAGALLDAGRFAMAGLPRLASATRQSTDDIEWNGDPIR